MWTSLWACLLLVGCDAPAPEAPEARITVAAPEPPPAFRALELGGAFLAGAWGPDLSADQVARFRDVADAAAAREGERRRALTDAQLALQRAVVEEAPEAAVQAAADALVAAEEALLAEQHATVVALYGVLDGAQRQRARQAAARLLADAVASPTLRRDADPFARVATDRFEDAELAEVLRLKGQVQGCEAAWSQAQERARVELGRIDVGDPAWADAWGGVAEHASEAYVPCRTDAVRQFAGFARRLAPERRARFLLDDAFLTALRPPDPPPDAPPDDRAEGPPADARGPGAGRPPAVPDGAAPGGGAPPPPPR